MTSRARLLSLVVGTLVVLVAAAWLEPYATTILWWTVRDFLPFLLVGLLMAALVPLAHRFVRWPGGGSVGVTWSALALGGLLAVGWFTYSLYLQDQDYAAAVRVVSGQPVPQLAERAPFLVGKAQAGPTLGDVTGDIADVSYLPDVDRFATLVERRGWLTGYEVAATQAIAVDGAGQDAQRCAFAAAADARIGGWFGHNLGRLINERQRWVRFDDGDAYAYCDGATPYVVVPLTRQVGLFVVTERPAGVARYNGSTGAVELVGDAAAVPGPTYPLSLAATQREATHAMGGFADWFFARSGWDASDDGANADNDSEFTLARTDGAGPQYVTPLTPRGSASSVVAVSMVSARYTAPDLAPVTVFRLDPTWASPQTVVARIKADYSDVCCYNLDQVFEVIPTGGDTWAATIGSEQALRFRVAGHGPLQGPEASCLRTVAGEPIRCGPRPATPEQQPADNTSDGGGLPASGADLQRMDNAELASLQGAVAAEVGRRLRQQPG